MKRRTRNQSKFTVDERLDQIEYRLDRIGQELCKLAVAVEQYNTRTAVMDKEKQQ